MTQQTTLVRAGVGETRDALDRHYTPQALTDLIVHEVDTLLFEAPRIIVEPSLGGGTFARSARKLWTKAHIIGVDCDAGAEGAGDVDEFIVGDWTEVASTLPEACLIVGNPPFSGVTAIKHVETCLPRAALTALILPWSFGGGVKRWHHLMVEPARPHEVRPIVPRPWPKKVRETALYCWWRHGVGSRPTQLKPLPRWK